MFNQGKDLNSISKELNLGKETVRRYLNNLGIKLPTMEDIKQKHKNNKQQCLNLLWLGLSKDKIAQIMQVGKSTINKYILELEEDGKIGGDSIAPPYMTPIKHGKSSSPKKVKCIETSEIFDSLKEACQWCDLKDSASIIQQIQGKKKSAGKHPTNKEMPLHWQYVE